MLRAESLARLELDFPMDGSTVNALAAIVGGQGNGIRRLRELSLPRLVVGDRATATTLLTGMGSALTTLTVAAFTSSSVIGATRALCTLAELNIRRADLCCPWSFLDLPIARVGRLVLVSGALEVRVERERDYGALRRLAAFLGAKLCATAGTIRGARPTAKVAVLARGLESLEKARACAAPMLHAEGITGVTFEDLVMRRPSRTTGSTGAFDG